MVICSSEGPMITPIRLRTELAKSQADSTAFNDIGHLHWQTQIFVARYDFEGASETLKESFKGIKRLKDPGLVIQARQILTEFYEQHRADFDEAGFKLPKEKPRMLPPPKGPDAPEKK